MHLLYSYVCCFRHPCSDIEAKKWESKQNQKGLKREHVCYHCMLVSFHMACEGTCVHQCLILTLDLVLTSVSHHANEHISVKQENVAVSHHKNRICKNRGGKTEKRDMVCQWYQHSKEVNQSAAH